MPSALANASYAKGVWSIGLDRYVETLAKIGVRGRRRILDVGAGPGQWLAAAGILNPEAELIGADPDAAYVAEARTYVEAQGLRSCSWIVGSYADLPAHVAPGSVDALFCNSVIQFLDVPKAIALFASFLAPGGILVMMHNEGPGYYVRRFFLYLRLRNWDRAAYSVRVLLNTPRLRRRSADGERFVSFRLLHDQAARHGVDLTPYSADLGLGYRERFLGLPCVFSCVGVKRS